VQECKENTTRYSVKRQAKPKILEKSAYFGVELILAQDNVHITFSLSAFSVSGV